MQIKELIKTLESNKDFKNWKKTHKIDYLVHIFKMVDETNKDLWQIGYYNKEEDQITTCILEKDKVQIVPETEIFRKEKHVIKKLNLTKIKVDFEKALEKALALQKKEYQAEKPIKIIAILQHLDQQLWNITFVTISFKTLNIKINAETGEIKSHDLKSLVDFKK